ncbi:MAG: diadenylate cyclase, partial [Chloroflexota bacterium]
QTGTVVGLFALVVIFQPELRRALERIGRFGSFGWLLAPTEQRAVEHVAAEIARAAGSLAAEGHGALIVIERETGLEEIAETGVMLHSDLSADLLVTIFMPRTALHDGAVIVRGDRIVAAAALLPLTETSLQSERFGTRHRAALGITEQTDALVVVVSEESGSMSLVERARIVRIPTEAQLERALEALLGVPTGRSGRFRLGGRTGPPGRSDGPGSDRRRSPTVTALATRAVVTADPTPVQPTRAPGTDRPSGTLVEIPVDDVAARVPDLKPVTRTVPVTGGDEPDAVPRDGRPSRPATRASARAAEEQATAKVSR